ncbi:MAG: hypothetical protein QOJ94_1573 [Sphingomonadales bacterium]|jgi:hypothetical protein|nr:hypothetical protein [Sphingomonadales bacterium]
MARTQGIAAVSATLMGLLRDRYPRDEFGVGLGFELYQARNFNAPMKEGIAICLWRVAPNTSRRNFVTRTDSLGRRFRGSLPIDLFYLIVPFAEQAERQQRLLGWVMRAMHEMGTLAPTQLNHYLAESDVFAEAESLDAVGDPLAVADYLTLWDRLKHLPPAATYVLRMLLLDSDIPIEEHPLVEERDFDMGVPAQ